MNARAVALRALMDGGFAAEDLDRELRTASLSPADRSFATELVYGTLKMRRSLEWSVSRHLTRPFGGLDERLRWVLLLGAYQLLYLDRVPAHSAVDEAVTLARTGGGNKGAAGFANAVLRKVATEKVRPPRPSSSSSSDDDAQALGLHASLPDWIAADLIERFGFETALLAAEGMNGAPRRALRLVGSAEDRSRTIDEARSAGVAIEERRYDIPECFVIGPGGSGFARDAIAARRAVRQSEESQLAVHLLDPRPGEIVIDACCGRGVKTSMIASRLSGNGAVWAIDDDERKLAALRASLSGVAGVNVVKADARDAYPSQVPRQADAALVDAPCSGLGVLGRRPDARWRKREHDPARFAPVQAAVLRRASERVRPGGRLLYVTCTTPPVEDEGVVDSFLRESPEWSAADVVLEPSAWQRKIGRHALTVPGIDGGDGFFYALLVRDGRDESRPLPESGGMAAAVDCLTV